MYKKKWWIPFQQHFYGLQIHVGSRQISLSVVGVFLSPLLVALSTGLLSRRLMLNTSNLLSLPLSLKSVGWIVINSLGRFRLLTFYLSQWSKCMLCGWVLQPSRLSIDVKLSSLRVDIIWRASYHSMRWCIYLHSISRKPTVELVGRSFTKSCFVKFSTFHASFIHRILQLVFGGQTVFCINGEVDPFLRTKRGLRQGDPIPPSR